MPVVINGQTETAVVFSATLAITGTQSRTINLTDDYDLTDAFLTRDDGWVTIDKPRSAAPIIGLGVLAAAIALTGVGIAASGAADPSHPGSLRVADPVTTASAQPAASEAPTAATASTAPTPEPGTTTAATPGVTSSVVSSVPGVTTSAAPVATPATAKPGASTSATAAKKSSSKPTAKASAKASASSTATAAAGGAAPTPSAAGAGAVPGNYPETSTGSATYTGGSMAINGTPTLVVSAATGQAQTQTVNDGSSSTVEKLVFGTNVVDSTELSITSQVIDADFVLSPQEPLLELTPGATWSWKADSTDGKEHLALSGNYVGSEQVTTGGVTETTMIVKNILTLTGSIATTITETDDYDPVYKLVLRDHSITKGTYDGIAYTIDTTTTLNSLKPS